ncbi:50S ribosomal protein L25/general stress protein Ctc [Thiomonas sp.]|jgi:large subunit ribosomal protein L25|uniref:50S ribosomal protein L25/general stress protein Ctc n=1 Tax=Thiomonas sp. TaxID=2047785 RepID=UPI0026209950|nr:50S ribosomal protein L25/general stress protein Ctc [Thiomonas sp.]
MKVVAFERQAQGTGASRRMRNAGKVPGIVYGGEQKPQLIELDHNALYHALKKEQFHSSILDLTVGEQQTKVLLKAFQVHPFRPLVLHVDFMRVAADRKISMKVPLHFKGAEESPAVKLEGAMITHVLNEIEVSCLPGDLPEFIEVDLSGLSKGHSLHASDLKLPDGVSVVTHGAENPAVASVLSKGGESSEEAAPAEGAAPAAP